MISRRNFLKFAGLAIAAAGTGYTSGKLVGTSEKYFVMQGFLPDDEQILRLVFNSLKTMVQTGTDPVIIASGLNMAALQKIAAPLVKKNGKGRVIIRINRLEKSLPSDILISDNSNYIHDPLQDHTVSISNIREQIKGKAGNLFFSIEYQETGILSSLFKGDGKTATVRNQQGIAERIELKKDYSRIAVQGAAGQTIIQIKNGMLRVTDSCCRNKICSHSGYIVQPGSLIACAPNKVLIRIETA